ncbi:MAG: sigma-70 family RNA polymerase sigma factor [Clostridia bacterium]|nr:sigma-70 family RNA polymerase sigma factor [Clostridia bacterium]
MTDKDIVALLNARNEKALEAIDLQFGNQLRGIIRGIVRDEEDASECLNDVYLKVWNAIPPARPDNLKAFLNTVARNTALDRYDTKHRKSDIPRASLVSADDGNAAELAGPERTDEAVEQKLKEERIRALLIGYTRKLPPGDQKICIARFFYNAKLREIARQYDMPVGTVKSALSRIKKGMAELLHKEGIDDD